MAEATTLPKAARSRSRSRRLRALARCLQELSRYLLYLRVPLLLLVIAVVAFITQQVRDVLLAMALEPDWGRSASPPWPRLCSAWRCGSAPAP